MSKKTSQIMFFLEPELHEAAKDLAWERKTTLSGLMRSLIMSEVEREGLSLHQIKEDNG